jgi:flagellar protein FlaF
VVYRLQYANIQADDTTDAKARERQVLQRSIDLFTLAGAPDSRPFVVNDAVHFTTRIWTAFLEDLAKPDNQLPKEARAGLISIGIWILREMDAIRLGTLSTYDDIIEISELIRDGLQ